MTDEALLRRITFNPEVFGGKPIIRGMRISVELILSLLAQGETVDAIVADYPDLEPEDVRASGAQIQAIRRKGGQAAFPLKLPAKTGRACGKAACPPFHARLAGMAVSVRSLPYAGRTCHDRHSHSLNPSGGEAWRAMVELAPVRFVANDPIYEVLPAHLEMLSRRGFRYEIIGPRGAAAREKRCAAAG